MKLLSTAALVCAFTLGAWAQAPAGQGSQDQPPQSGQGSDQQGQPMHGQRRGGREGGFRGMMGSGRPVGGEITAINGKDISVKAQDGAAATIHITDSTRFMRNGDARLSDFKIGDTIMAGGTQEKDGTWTANFVVDRTEQMRQMKENLGKTMIAGEVTAIADTKLTILRPDGVTQVIEADENTSFRKHGESVTLADVKVGDRVMGRGALKSGVFVPTELRFGAPGEGGRGMMMRGGERPRTNEQAPPKQQ